MLSLFLLPAILGYLLGSIPVGYLVGRSRGIDIREHGSGNIGATNVVRVLGKRPGYFVFVCDALKGWLAVAASQWLVFLSTRSALQSAVRNGLDLETLSAGYGEFAQAAIIVGIVAALACILGHNFPVWLKFRGGKGVATTVGVLLGLMPAAIGVSAVVWIVSFYAFRYVSLASLLGAAALPVAVWLLIARHGDPALHNPLLWFSLAAALLIFWRHRTNIQRLLNGTEARFGRKPATAAPKPEV